MARRAQVRTQRRAQIRTATAEIARITIGRQRLDRLVEDLVAGSPETGGARAVLRSPIAGRDLSRRRSGRFTRI